MTRTWRSPFWSVRLDVTTFRVRWCRLFNAEVPSLIRRGSDPGIENNIEKLNLTVNTVVLSLSYNEEKGKSFSRGGLIFVKIIAKRGLPYGYQ